MSDYKENYGSISQIKARGKGEKIGGENMEILVTLIIQGNSLPFKRIVFLKTIF
jgi:hypothetical protein